MFQDHLERQSCHTEQATADPDLLIMQTAVAASENVSNVSTFKFSSGWDETT